MKYTGERVIPDDPERHDLYVEHLARYAFASRWAGQGRVLDVGCGCGYGTALLAGSSAFALGADLSQEAIRYAHQHYDRANLTYALMDARRLGLAGAGFDLVVSFEFIEHIQDQEAFVHQVVRAMRPEGTFIVSTPNVDRYSTETREKNEFHRRELDLAGFTSLLEGSFECVQVLGQTETAEFINHWQSHEYLRVRQADLEERVKQTEARLNRLKDGLRHPWRALAWLVSKPGIPQTAAEPVQLPTVPPLRIKRLRDVQINADSLSEARFYVAVCSRQRV
jgi:2-polyprenyl-3-methyl-5-hydroxy-6-metoxy-1,4-benzoquinol methylase